MKQYDLCLKLAIMCHRGQKRKFDGEPYINHPSRVSKRFKTSRLRCAALLHDVIEDTGMNAATLLQMGVNSDIVDLVLILTKRKYETYEDYILRISQDDAAKEIKIQDILDNLSDLPDTEHRLAKKYRAALKVLLE